jgi:hypothetical protein
LNNQKLFRIVTFLLALVLGYFATTHFRKNSPTPPQNPHSIENASIYSNSPATSTPTEHFTDHSEVEGKGTVIKILSDDHKTDGDNGSRHQRFILRLDSEQTVLIAHNIDLAPRIEILNEDDTIVFKGVYVSNDKGGVIHWTHRDPLGQHEDGWLKRNGKIYQ